MLVGLLGCAPSAVKTTDSHPDQRFDWDDSESDDAEDRPDASEEEDEAPSEDDASEEEDDGGGPTHEDPSEEEEEPPADDEEPPADDDGPPTTGDRFEYCNGEDDDGDGYVDEGYPDTDEDGTADCVDEEECDGLDNDGDGLIDEGFDEDHDDTADCMETIYGVDFHVTVDDTWDGTIDGEDIAATTGWNGVDTFEWDLDSGTHVITVHGEDLGEAISGFLGSVVIDGDVTFSTGDGSWRVSDSGPEAGWLSPGFSDSHWRRPVACTDLSPWGDWTSEPLEHGAEWVWYHSTGDCRAPSSWGEAWFRLEFTLP
jgi:hypothetical protein